MKILVYPIQQLFLNSWLGKAGVLKSESDVLGRPVLHVAQQK